MGNVSARDHQYPSDESSMHMNEEGGTAESGSGGFPLSGMEAKVRRVHVDGLVRTKEDVVCVTIHIRTVTDKYHPSINF